MISENPFDDFRKECETRLAHALEKALPDVKVEPLSFNKPPNLAFGQLASSLCFELAKKFKQKPSDLAAQLVKAIGKPKLSLLEKVTAAGGYVNFHVNFPKFSALTLESIRQLDSAYGFVKTEKPVKVIVEHTSVNPLHPIHIGQARNPMLGDTIGRILLNRGHDISRHYYVCLLYTSDAADE